ncbi:ras-related protein Rab-44 isoform X3 [Coturnix japonica]|uniref:ras-related protein Rab-44 isoform X3 n=1 Tax=Coturnix japonica TaxID=93934 RepID=UPI000777756E|nr:ras-related protein Rab-44 isoform X3 [Coturnix japonica]
MAEQRVGSKGRRMGSSRRRQLRKDAGEEPPWAAAVMQRVQDVIQEQRGDAQGFVTRGDMQKLQGEVIPCSTEELELLFDGMDAAGTGQLSIEEFTSGLRQFLCSQKISRDHRRWKAASRRSCLVLASPTWEEMDSEEKKHFAAFMEQLGVDDRWEEQQIWQLWAKLRKDEPQLMGNLEAFLAKMRHRIQEVRSKKEALEETLNKRVAEHNQEVQQLCEALEQQIQEERQRMEQESTARSRLHCAVLQRALDARDKDMQRLVAAQQELEAQCRSLSSTQRAASAENQQLEENNRALEEQLQHIHAQLQQTHECLRAAMAQQRAEEARDGVEAELLGETLPSPQVLQVCTVWGCWDVTQSSIVLCGCLGRGEQQQTGLLPPYLGWEYVETEAGKLRIVSNGYKTLPSWFCSPLFLSLLQMSPEQPCLEMQVGLGSQGSEPKRRSTHHVVWEKPPSDTNPSRLLSVEEDPFPEFLKEERFSGQGSLLREMNDAIAALSTQKLQALGAAGSCTHDDAEPQTEPSGSAPRGTHISHKALEEDLREGRDAAELRAGDGTQADVQRIGGSGQAAQRQLQEQVSAQADKGRLHAAPQQPQKPPGVMEAEQAAAGPAETLKQEVLPTSALHMGIQQGENATKDVSGVALGDSPLVSSRVQLLEEQKEELDVGKKQEMEQKMSLGGEPSPGEPEAATMNGAGAAPKGSLEPDHLYNVLFVGDSHVGKTSFLYRLHADTFNPHLAATVGMDYQVKNLMVDNKRFALRLWDSAGQERYRSITKQFFRKADGVVLMYDITSQYSFADVHYWLSCIQEGAEDGVTVLLLGNKTDCAAERQVPTQEGERLAQEHQLLFYECSAASGHNVTESIVSLVRALKVSEDRLRNKAEEVPKPPQKKKGCCW